MNYEMINEELNIDFLKNLAKEFNLNLTFVVTFGSAIAAFYPMAEHIIYNQNYNIPITKEGIILCIISAFGIIFKEFESDKLKEHIKENGFSEIVNYFVKSLKSFKNIYEYLMSFKSIEFLTDTFTYTTILAPFMLAIKDIISDKVMTIEELIGCGMSIGAGIITLTVKNIVKSIWNNFSKKLEKNNNKTMENILKFDDFTLNERRKNVPRKSNLSDVEYVTGGVKYKNELFPGINLPKRYLGKGKHKYRVLAKEGEKVKPINFGDKTTKPIEQTTKLKKKYWENLPNWK